MHVKIHNTTTLRAGLEQLAPHQLELGHQLLLRHSRCHLLPSPLLRRRPPRHLLLAACNTSLPSNKNEHHTGHADR